MKVFEKLRSLRVFEREQFDFLETIEDFDLVKEIGYHQEAGMPLTLKLLFLQNIGSVATVQRRLRRLKRLGAVQQRRSDGDRRNVELTISPDIWTRYRKAALVLKKAGCDSPSRAVSLRSVKCEGRR